MRLTTIAVLAGCCLAISLAQSRDKACKKDDGLFPHEQYCDYYYDCVDGVATLQLCPNGLAFTGKGRGLLAHCDYPHRAQCPDEDGRVMGQTPQGPANCGWLYGVFAHQTSCTRYWQCWNGTATAQQCPLSLLYNDALHSCDWPDNVPDCQKHPLCKDTPNGKIGINNACVRYWLCVGGYPRLQRCSAGLAFSPTTQRCELAQLVPECEPPPTTESPDEEPAERPSRPADRPSRPVDRSPRPTERPSRPVQPPQPIRGRLDPRPINIDLNQGLGDDDQGDNQDQPLAPPPRSRRPNTRPAQFRPPQQPPQQG